MTEFGLIRSDPEAPLKYSLPKVSDPESVTRSVNEVQALYAVG